jgi:hypothetical protein
VYCRLPRYTFSLDSCRAVEKGRGRRGVLIHPRASGFGPIPVCPAPPPPPRRPGPRSCTRYPPTLAPRLCWAGYGARVAVPGLAAVVGGGLGGLGWAGLRRALPALFLLLLYWDRAGWLGGMGGGVFSRVVGVRDLVLTSSVLARIDVCGYYPYLMLGRIVVMPPEA